MGLFANYFEFDRETPTMQQIADALVPLIPDALAIVATFDAEKAMWSEPRSTLLVCDTRIRVTLAARPEPRRRPGARRRFGPRCEIVEHASGLTLYGWGDPLDAARRVLESLGGVQRPFPLPKHWQPRKPRYPVRLGTWILVLTVMCFSFVVVSFRSTRLHPLSPTAPGVPSTSTRAESSRPTAPVTRPALR